MMGLQDRVRTDQLHRYVGERVKVSGWLHTHRKLGGVVFTLLRDGWGVCQIVSTGDDALAKVTPESILAVQGEVVAEPKAPGGVELRDCTWSVMVSADPPPFSLGKRELKLAPSNLLDQAPVSLRHPSRRSVFRLSSRLVHAFRQTLTDQGFTEIHSPKIVGGAAEGGANVFAVDYFGEAAFLAQSPQLYKQMMVGVFERVFETGPVFRAEPHDTPRHLNQYTSLDAEIGFITDHGDVMRLVESVVVRMVQAAEATGQGEMPIGEWRRPLLTEPFPAIPFWEAAEVIQRYSGRSIAGEEDLSPQDERDLGEWARKTYQSDFLFVTGYPLRKRPFYTHPHPERPEYSNSFDLLFRGLEIVTGGQRLHVHSDYLRALKSRGMDATPFQGYLKAFRHGMPPHGGFGMGLERFTAQILGVANVRETALFPRTMTRMQP